MPDGQELGLALQDTLENIDGQLPDAPDSSADELSLDPVDDQEPVDRTEQVFGSEEGVETDDAAGPDKPEGEDKTSEPAEISPALLQTAAALGIPEHMAKLYGSESALQAAMNPILAQRIQARAQPPTVPVQAPSGPQTIKPGEAQVTGFKLDLPKLDPAEFEGETVEHFNKMSDQLTAMNAHYAGMAEQQQQVIGQLVLQNQQAVLESERGTFDAWVAKQGDEWKDLLGEGSSVRLDPHSPQLQNRNAIFRARQDQEKQYRAIGVTPPPMEELLTQALHSTFYAQAGEIARKAHGVKVAEHKKRATARPSSRRSDKSRPKHRLDSAIEHLTAKGQEIGLYNMLQ